MITNLKQTETELLVITSAKAQNNIDNIIPSLSIGESEIVPSKSVQNLGVQMVPHLSMEKQVMNVCKLANNKIRNIGLKRRLLD